MGSDWKKSFVLLCSKAIHRKTVWFKTFVSLARILGWVIQFNYLFERVTSFVLGLTSKIMVWPKPLNSTNKTIIAIHHIQVLNDTIMTLLFETSMCLLCLHQQHHLFAPCFAGFLRQARTTNSHHHRLDGEHHPKNPQRFCFSEVFSTSPSNHLLIASKVWN